MDYRVGGKLPELSGWKSCDQQLKVQDLSLRDPWQGQHSSVFTNDLDNGTQCAPSRLTGVTKLEGTVPQLEQ